jgi:hypothetical protein
MHKPFALVPSLLAAVFLAACSSNQQSSSQPTAAPSIANPLDFPLYKDARVVATHDFTQTVNTTGNGTRGEIMSHGNGTYKGHEVIAATPANFSELSAWARGLDDHPPSGYTTTVSSTQAHSESNRFGIDYATFQRTQQGKTTSVLVVVMDPAKVSQRVGPVLNLISTYKKLPDVMRAPIDEKVKAQTGMTVSEATSPDSPIGAALAALEALQHSNARGIVVLDATKQ